ncbi:MAG: tyrosine-type recombinase/integrase [Anaerolineaceae bacterium]
MPSANENLVFIDKNTSLQPAIQTWKIFLRDQNKSIYTIKAFEGDLKLLSAFLPADKTIGSITTNDLQHFLEWVNNGRGKNIPCSPKSLSRRITTVKSFFNWLFFNGRIPMDPAEKILQKSVISPLPEVLTDDELILALAAAADMIGQDHPDTRPYALFKLLLETGIKKSECLNIKLQHIDESDPQNPFLFVRYSDAKDRNKERKIPLSPAWIQFYKRYIDQYKPEDFVFPWSPRRLEYILEDINKAAHLEKHISFSMCRWTCALNDFRKGVDRDLIRQHLGISKIQWREIDMKLQQLAQNPNGTI